MGQIRITLWVSGLSGSVMLTWLQRCTQLQVFRFRDLLNWLPTYVIKMRFICDGVEIHLQPNHVEYVNLLVSVDSQRNPA